MTLWNLIRDFFVENIFGGYMSNGQSIANQISRYGGVNINTANAYVDCGLGHSSGIAYISIGDWLSTTFTIITLILLVLVLYIFVKWIFKLFAGLLH